MKEWLGRASLYLFCILLTSQGQNEMAAAGFLAAAALDSLTVLLTGKALTALYLCCVGVCALGEPFLSFLPVFIYSCAQKKEGRFGLVFLLPILGRFHSLSLRELLSLSVLCLLAWEMGTEQERYRRMSRDYGRIQDSTREEASALKRKNRELLEKQDYEVRLATLEERNRIAREIHDNVGHLLTRSILQVSALKVVCRQDEKLAKPLAELSGTLKDAMDNIRTSVHDLKEEAFDLNLKVSELIADFSFCPVRFRCDGEAFPQDVKYCFLAIIKEGLSNIARHSNATEASVVLLEHPALYQLILEDNGTKKPRDDGGGIGLLNIQERVEKLGGIFHIDQRQGFRLSVSIPKGEKIHETADY